MLAALYARVSTGRQEKEKTIRSQMLAIQEFAKEKGHTIVKEYLDDGWTGTILARPGLDELRLDAKQKVWEALIVYDPDRIARKYSYQALVVDELEEAGINVLFITTPPAKTTEDKLLYGVKGLFAEYERARSADRFRLGKLRKAKEGNVVTSSGPYGYRYIPKQGSKQGYYEIIEDEAKVVRQIFSWVANNRMTIRQVVRKLQELGIKPRKSKRGVWNTSTLTTMLRNRTYIGKAHYNKSYAVVPENPIKNTKYKKVKKTSRRNRKQKEWIEIETPQIIDEALFIKTRKQLAANFELCKRNSKNQYLLSGKIFCTCGRKRNGEGPQKGKHLYYRCTDRVYSFPLPPKCKERGVNARVADALVWKGIKKVMSDPELLMEQAEKWKNKKQDSIKSHSSSINDLKSELEGIKKEEQRYIKAYGSEMISMEQLEDAMKDLKMRRAVVEKQISGTAREVDRTDVIIPSQGELEDFCTEAASHLSKVSFESQQAIVREVVDNIVATQEKLRVIGYLPFNKGFNYVKYTSISRDCGFAKRGEVDTF